MEVYHYQGKRKIKLNQSKQLMADERSEVTEAYAGDVIGVFDPGIFSIGDTITTGKNILLLKVFLPLLLNISH